MSASTALYQTAQQYIPGGVNSPVRAYGGVGGTPKFIKRGQGAYIIDEDNHRYIDYVGSWGPLILGHCHPNIILAVEKALYSGLSFGAPTAIEVEVARKICEIYPSIERIRMVNSGTEATMTAIRLARGYTKRDKIIKFEGCYHGHSDSLLVKAGSGLLTFGTPSSAGVPASFAEHTLIASFNDLDQVAELFKQYPNDIAGIILEPVPGNMNCILPQPGFLQGLRQLCDEYNSVLIFDEVITGFRVALGGAQQHYNITPDLTTLGKIIGGGMPVGAVGGKQIIMDCLAPLGPVYQAGTLSGNPIAMAAGLATLDEITKPGFYADLDKRCQQLTDGIVASAKRHGIALLCNRIGSMFGLFFTEQTQVNCFEQVMACNVALFKQAFHRLLQAGIYLAPSAFESCFISNAHGKDEIQATIQAFDQVFIQLAQHHSQEMETK